MTTTTSPQQAIRPRFVMIGGFLGAGKTTAILQFAKWLRSKKGLRVGIITNDQAEGLVDTHLAKGASFATSEIAGGCFCCKSDALIEAADKLTDEVRPDIFIAEPVGSCTDLIATVSLPLLTIYKREYELSPLAVLIDPFRASRVLEDRPHKGGGDDGASKGFSADVDYIYRKQLEEAEIIVINKVDVLAADRLERIKELVHKRYPAAEVQAVSARSGKGLDEWFDMLLNRQLNVTRLMEVDYDRYGRGEAKLGWFNGTYSAESANGEAFDGNKLLLDFATNVKGRFASFRTEVAHLKATLVTDDNGDDATILGAVQWVSSDRAPELTLTLTNSIQRGILTINVRAEDDPERIAHTVEEVLSQSEGISISALETSRFRPGQPNPVHRLTSLS